MILGATDQKLWMFEDFYITYSLKPFLKSHVLN
jgi:hypothetical protein